ncbi:glycosyltransferase family 4 protein [Saccharicrinis sp. FJH62]|uniref:glycosyltransferase family 4 protein n=1 Tax=Saccharicrinis sp. FJH62 TaxID=3344657 RepID=UPI0035D469C7
MKKVLIITYYWPPSGGAGVQRWLKFTRYLPENGWIPVVFTPENPEAPAEDRSLLDEVPDEVEVVKLKIWEPFEIYKKLTGRSKNSKINAGFLKEETGNSFAEKVSLWIRGNLFIPDAKRFWIRPSVKFLVKMLKEQKVDVIVSTGPPHSMHIIAEKVSKRTKIPWIADFRDPWTDIDFYDKLRLSGWADRMHHKLQLKVLKNADEVVIVGRNWAKGLQRHYSRKIEVITNGYDKADITTKHVKYPEKFSIVHVGSINADRNHSFFWASLEYCIENVDGFSEDFELMLVGKNDVSVTLDIRKYGLSKHVNFISYIPHNEVIAAEQKAAVLYLPLNNTPNAKGILTGKFFEYLASGRPIFAIGPVDGDLAHILNETGAGTISDFDDQEGMKKNLITFYKAFKNKSLTCKSENIRIYERSELTKKMVELFESVL